MLGSTFSIYLILVGYLLQSYKNSFPRLIFHCNKNEYLKFLRYHYLDLYNVNHRLPLNAVRGSNTHNFSSLQRFDRENYKKKER